MRHDLGVKKLHLVVECAANKTVSKPEKEGSMKRNLYVGALFLILLVALLAASSILQKKAAVEAAGVQAPRFEVDPLWPKPLPKHWLQGQTIGVSVDDKDHIWVIHRAGSLEPGELHATTTPPIAMCCRPAPPILNFDQEG